jgi:hypothetical protein
MDQSSTPATPGRQRIDMLHDADVHFWCRLFDVTPAQLRYAVQHVGPQADAVRRHLMAQVARPN